MNSDTPVAASSWAVTSERVPRSAPIAGDQTAAATMASTGLFITTSGGDGVSPVPAAWAISGQ